MSRVTPKILADELNKYSKELKLFWVVGLVKDTIDVWRIKKNYNLLEEIPRQAVDYYLDELERD